MEIWIEKRTERKRFWKLESKISRLQSFKKARKQTGWNEWKETVIQSGKKTVCKENKLSLQKENNHSGFRAFNMERKKTVCQSERMEWNKDVSQKRIITMKKETLYVAFSTQKGGVGKTTFTVLVASYLYYLKGAPVKVA